MPFDGNGIYNPIDPPDFPAEAGTIIRAAQYNNQINDMATALSNCLTRDGQGEPTANLSMNGFRLTNLAEGTAAADAIRRDQVDPLVNANLADGFVLDNNKTIRMKNTGGVEIVIALIFTDNNIYFCYDAAGNWFMRYNTSLGQVEFNKPVVMGGNLRVNGNIVATGNVGAFQP